jgi:hypothetical protein
MCSWSKLFQIADFVLRRWSVIVGGSQNATNDADERPTNDWSLQTLTRAGRPARV